MSFPSWSSLNRDIFLTAQHTTNRKHFAQQLNRIIKNNFIIAPERSLGGSSVISPFGLWTTLPTPYWRNAGPTQSWFFPKT
jgi:hypothetical protein